MDELSPAKCAKSYREYGVLKVRCPHCGEVNEFPEFDVVYIFLCDYCGEPVEV